MRPRPPLVNAALTSVAHGFVVVAGHSASMTEPLYLADRASVRDAGDLIARHGPAAAFHAALRAEESRERGNAIHFCRWRQIERLIDLLGDEAPRGTVH